MDTVTSKDGTKIAFDRLGAGSPVIVIGGALCDRGTTRATAEHLAQHFSVINYDRRGRGDSSDTAPYAVEREIEDLAALVEATGGAAAVYGHSSGAALLVHAAAYGLPITKVVLHDPPYSVDSPDRRIAVDLYARELDALLAADRRSDAVALFNAMVGIPATMIEQWRNQPWWKSMEAIAPTLAYDCAIIGIGAVPTDELGRISQPGLVVTGEGWMNDIGRQVAQAVPHGEHTVLAGQGHVVPPEVLLPAILGFLSNE